MVEREYDDELLAKEFLELLNALTLMGKVLINPDLVQLSRAEGITQQRIPLLYTLSLRDSWSLKDLSDALAVSSSNLSTMVDSMYQSGLVSREPDTDDRRRISVRLTEEGQKLLACMTRAFLAPLQSWIGELSDEDRRRLKDAVLTIRGLLPSV